MQRGTFVQTFLYNIFVQKLDKEYALTSDITPANVHVTD